MNTTNKKRGKRIAAICVCLMMLATMAPADSLADTLLENNLAGSTVPSIENGAQMSLNMGHVVDNYGSIIESFGSVTNNYSFIRDNGGTVSINAENAQINKVSFIEGREGSVARNFGTINYCYGKVDINANTGQIRQLEKNHTSENSGVVNYNNGEIGMVAEDATVEHNEGTINNNYGTVENNKGTVEKNYGTVVNDGGVVENNYAGTVTGTGTIEKDFVEVTGLNKYGLSLSELGVKICGNGFEYDYRIEQGDDAMTFRFFAQKGVECSVTMMPGYRLDFTGVTAEETFDEENSQYTYTFTPANDCTGISVEYNNVRVTGATLVQTQIVALETTELTPGHRPAHAPKVHYTCEFVNEGTTVSARLYSAGHLPVRRYLIAYGPGKITIRVTASQFINGEWHRVSEDYVIDVICNHNNLEMKHHEEKHWEKCTAQNCDYTTEPHKNVIQYDDQNHWLGCEDENCTFKVNETPHVFDNDADTTCSGCDYVRTIPGGGTTPEGGETPGGGADGSVENPDGSITSGTTVEQEAAQDKGTATGDDFNMAIWAVLMVLAAAGTAGALFRRKAVK